MEIDRPNPRDLKEPDREGAAGSKAGRFRSSPAVTSREVCRRSTVGLDAFESVHIVTAHPTARRGQEAGLTVLPPAGCRPGSRRWPGSTDSSASDQVRAGVVYRGSEVETLAGKGERVDPEYLSVAINQRATRVPWVHCGVRLDECGKLRVPLGDDARGRGSLKTVGTTDRDSEVTNAGVVSEI
jgi:hypothetical protein